MSAFRQISAVATELSMLSCIGRCRRTIWSMRLSEFARMAPGHGTRMADDKQRGCERTEFLLIMEDIRLLTRPSGSVRSGYESCVASAPSGSENLAQRLSKSRKEVKTTDQPVDSPMTCIRPMFRKYNDQSRSALEAKRRP